MHQRDLDTVLAIENLVHISPWTRGIFNDCLRVGYLCKVLEHHEKLQGYGVVSVMADEAHILNICVDAASQRKGYGSILIEHFITIVQPHANTIFLEARLSNVAALAMYDGFEFNQVGIREDYYPTGFGGHEDAYILAKELS